MSKRKINKSEEIRQYATQNPDASAKAVVEALEKKGVFVTPATVATVKSKAGLTKRRKSTPGRRPQSVSIGGSNVSVDILCAAKSLAVKAGSTKSAIEALRALEKIDSISV